MTAAVLIERNLMIYKHTWYVLLAEIFEPILYLLSIGVGIGVLVGTVTDVPGGDPVRYAAYVAPALLATAAMNGAMNETTYLMFGKLKADRTYESMLATPLTERDVALGEIGWAVLRGTLVSLAFLAVITALGLVRSPWALLVVPGAALIAFAFATAGVVVVTLLRDWPDLQYVQLVMLPMFLFATTFYPLSVYPRPVQLVVQALPLYQAIELLRNPALGILTPKIAVAALYLATMGAVCLTIAVRRLARTLSL
ncbi:ABC transporter permease [Actinoplanes palleronii]|uniref:Transport permease protein n=1 Tax=Actinoplanes palleronii TaxID=113570 RepID=A0ABQ4BSX0_9ACTN|nr:ABC transporter permease [Actinoplanes palleronii]GIE73778.1 transport permease protein [Actinoplanes palleronii]